MPYIAKALSTRSIVFAARPCLHRASLSTVKAAHNMTSKQQPKILSTEQAKVDGVKWLRMDKIKWQDEDGKERLWEAANRTTRKGLVDSVHILALLHHPSRPLSVILIEQFRPPIGKVVVELPAGLVDEGEDAKTAGLRELYEETGYGSKGDGDTTVDMESVVLVKDPGMTGANCQLVTISVKLGENDPEPEQHLDPGEHIVRRIVPLKDLSKTLADYDAKGFAVDALVSSIAMGYDLAGKYQ